MEQRREWQGVRKVTEALTAVDDDWGESMFATNVVFEPLIGELFRSNLVHAARPRPTATSSRPTVMGAGEYDYSQRDLRWTQACFGPLVADREFADHNKAAHAGLAVELGARSAWRRRARMQPLWSQPDTKPPRFEDSLDRAKSRFAGIVSDLGLQTPKELTQ